MSPDHHHTPNMAWQKSKPTENANLRGLYDDGKSAKRSSISSDSSSSSVISITRRGSSAKILDKIKYFERKTDHTQTEPNKAQNRQIPGRRLSLKKIIDDVKENFPENVDVSNETNAAIPMERNSNSPGSSYNEHNRLEPEPQVRKIENIEEPPKRLSVRKTINDAREEFTKGYLDISPSLNSSYSDSKCARFFATSNDEVLLKEMAIQGQFRVLLKGCLYNNNFYPAELAGEQMRYYIHDFIDYDLSPFEQDIYHLEAEL